MNDDIDSHPLWDAKMARRLKGKLILVGLSFFGSSGVLVKEEEFCGRVISLNKRAGILLSLEGLRSGGRYNLPPEMRAIREADPGEYRLRTSGEVVVDPDFIVTYRISIPTVN